MARQPDPSIPADESLYRSTRKEHVEGQIVMPKAFAEGMPAPSFNRSSYSTPQRALEGRPHHTRVVQIRVCKVPFDVVVEQTGERAIVAVVDCPEEDEEAHCEVRARRESQPFDRDPGSLSKGMRRKFRRALADVASPAI